MKSVVLIFGATIFFGSIFYTKNTGVTYEIIILAILTGMALYMGIVTVYEKALPKVKNDFSYIDQGLLAAICVMVMVSVYAEDMVMVANEIKTILMFAPLILLSEYLKRRSQETWMIYIMISIFLIIFSGIRVPTLLICFSIIMEQYLELFMECSHMGYVVVKLKNLFIPNTYTINISDMKSLHGKIFVISANIFLFIALINLCVAIVVVDMKTLSDFAVTVILLIIFLGILYKT